MEGVPDSAWSRTLYNAYFEAYAILKADATCPPDLLAEVAALCEQFREGEEFLDGDSGEQSGESGGDEPVADGGEVETHDDETGGDSSESDDGGSVEGEADEPESGAPEWNGETVDDDLSVFDQLPGDEAGGGGASGGGVSSGDAYDDDDDGGLLLNPSSGGGGSGGRAPSSVNELYGRGGSSGGGGSGGGAFYSTAGSYFGAGTTADASVATNYVDEVPFELLQWKYGGFKPATNAVRSTVTISMPRFSGDGMRFNWVRDLGAWGIPYEVPDALACLFVKNEEGEWIGGKFEWISSSRDAREFKNVRSGYNGWNLRGVPNPCAAAFVVFRKDGRRRSNIVVGLWER
ncbi:MAG: hypothetical protein IJ678_01825 [Kiritimatiellae bacterium]|nr:hypothetical protein [Kiritimatiellia bacterium]